MPEHLSLPELQAFAAREVSASEILRLDGHLASCDACSEALGRIASLRVATGMLRRVERAGPHLSYEQFETLVAGKASVDAAVQTHLDGCDACAHELAEMQGYAATLSASIEHRDMPSPSLLSRLMTWMRSPRG